MANPDLAFGALAKPHGIDRAIAKHAKRVAKSRAKRALDAKAAAEWDVLKRAVYERDKGRCRVCGHARKLRSENPLDESDAHHIVFRSAGGENTTTNLVTVCSWPCHRHIHEHRLSVTGSGDGEIVIQEIHPETGRVVRQWESRAPERNS